MLRLAICSISSPQRISSLSGATKFHGLLQKTGLHQNIAIPASPNPHQRMWCPSSLATRLTALMRVLKKEWKPPQCAMTKLPCGSGERASIGQSIDVMAPNECTCLLDNAVGSRLLPS